MELDVQVDAVGVVVSGERVTLTVAPGDPDLPVPQRGLAARDRPRCVAWAVYPILYSVCTP